LKDLVAINLPVVQPAKAVYKQPEIEYIRASDGSKVACRVWKGEVGQCVVLYLHGIEGHSQWFENTASVLNSKGITIYAIDRRGSGLNPRDRGHMPNYTGFLDDIEIWLRHLFHEYKGHPLVLMSNCWSAKATAVIAAGRHKGAEGPLSLLSGVVMTCPAIYTKVDFDIKTKLRIGYHAIRQDRVSLPIPLTTEMLTDNPTFIGYLKQDPLRLSEATAQFYLETFKLSKLAEGAAKDIQLPLLILQAGSDRIVDVPALEKWFAQCKSEKKDLRIFPDAVHSLDFDSTWFSDYTNVLGQWLKARSPVISR
jgi:acylglycerol lipase